MNTLKAEKRDMTIKAKKLRRENFSRQKVKAAGSVWKLTESRTMP